jgi:hypothetical protein
MLVGARHFSMPHDTRDVAPLPHGQIGLADDRVMEHLPRPDLNVFQTVISQIPDPVREQALFVD